MHLDVFKSSAFDLMTLTAAINKIPHVPTRLGKMGLFVDEGVSTTSVSIEMQDGVLTLVPTASRGAPGAVKGVERRNLRNFNTVHLPQRVSVLADEVQNLRAFGKETEEELATARLAAKMAVARRDLDITHEWQRMGCLKGQVLDADGSTVLYNYFTEFGVSQSTAAWALTTDATKVRSLCVALTRTIESKLGGVMNSGVHVLCSAEFFDKLVDHPAVAEAYKRQNDGAFLREDKRNGFMFGEVFFEEYRGAVGATRFIAANKAYAIPMGVPDLFKSFYAPAPYMETVNTVGLPFYAKQKSLDYDLGLEVQVQSNPLHICTRPDVVVEITAS